jgi:hypothetical protein
MEQKPNESSVYSLQQDLTKLIDEAKQDESEVNDPQIRQALKNTRGLFETFLTNLNTPSK